MPIFKEAIWVGFGQIGAMAGTFCAVAILAGLLGPEKYGEFALALTVGMVTNRVVMGGIIAGAGRLYRNAVDKGNTRSFRASVYRAALYACAVIVAVGGVTLVFLRLLQDGAWEPLWIFAILLAALAGVNAIFSAILSAARQRRVVAIHQLMESWIKCGLFFLVIDEVGASAGLAVLLCVISMTLSVASQMRRVHYLLEGPDPGSNEVQLKDAAELKDFALQYSKFGVTTSLFVVSDRWLLLWFCGSSEVGEYAFAYQFFYTPLMLLVGFLSSLLSPVIYDKVGMGVNKEQRRGLYQMGSRVAKVVLTVAVCLGVMLIMFGLSPSVRSYLPEDFSESFVVSPLMVVAAGFFAVGQLLSILLVAWMRARDLSRINVAVSLSGLVINVVAVYMGGVQGAAVGQVLYGVAQCFLVWGRVRSLAHAP